MAPAHSVKKWTPEEEKKLFDLLTDHSLSMADRARIMGRTERSVAHRVSALKEIAPEALAAAKASTPADFVKPPPSYEELFKILKTGPINLADLCKKFDKGPQTIRDMIELMRKDGYYIVERPAGLQIPLAARPRSDEKIATLADQVGMVVGLGIISDLHGGSITSQPSAMRSFVRIAHDEYGVRHFANPGDMTAGIYGYRGFEEDLIPSIVPGSRMRSAEATKAQVDIVDDYIPELDNSVFFMLGGNHDWWHVVSNGLDPVRMICNKRPNFVYMGYDTATIPLTDRVKLRLWHPGGGAAYARSYRLQKGMEAQAYEDLTEAMLSETMPDVTVLIAGHLHSLVYVPIGPMHGWQAPCFQGKTNLEKRKGLTPQIAGLILRFLITDSGHIQRVEFTPIFFEEIMNDWASYYVPVLTGEGYESDRMDNVFEWVPTDQSFPSIQPNVIENPQAGLGPGGHEYVGGHG